MKVSSNASVCMTDGSKDPSDFIFRFEDPDAKPEPSKTNGKSKPAGKTESDSRSAKISGGVVVGSKVLRGKTRQQLLDPDASKTVSAKISEHQKELHAQRQEDGIARYAGEDEAAGEDRGKAWKRFTSYKGEAGLPRESEALRVRLCPQLVPLCFCLKHYRSMSTVETKALFSRSMDLLCLSTSILSKMLSVAKQANTCSCASIY